MLLLCAIALQLGNWEAGRASPRHWVAVPLISLAVARTSSAPHQGDILSTAWHGCELGEVARGESVAIWGAGPGESGAAVGPLGRRRPAAPHVAQPHTLPLLAAGPRQHTCCVRPALFISWHPGSPLLRGTGRGAHPVDRPQAVPAGPRTVPHPRPGNHQLLGCGPASHAVRHVGAVPPGCHPAAAGTSERWGPSRPLPIAPATHA